MNEVQWHFSPARAPHFGGLWEAGVRSMKMLLRKTVGQNLLTYEEFTTVLADAEATMNSRPLAPVETHAEDGVAPLTPGHFLVGRSLKALPLTTDGPLKIHSSKRWNLVQVLSNQLWNRWHTEYLQHLQNVNKWQRPDHPLCVGDVVLLKDRDQFQHYWPMGRVAKLYPGTDGQVRVVDVTIGGKTYNRAVRHLVLLVEESPGLTTTGEDVWASNHSS